MSPRSLKTGSGRDAWYNVALGIVGTAGDRVLLVERSDTAFFSGYWGLPGGSFEFEEHGKSAVLREIREETALLETDLTEPALVGIGLERLEERLTSDSPGQLKARWQLYYYSIQLRKQRPFAPEARWFSAEELRMNESVIPSVCEAVELLQDIQSRKFDFFLMEDTVSKVADRLELSLLHVDVFRRVPR